MQFNFEPSMPSRHCKKSCESSSALMCRNMMHCFINSGPLAKGKGEGVWLTFAACRRIAKKEREKRMRSRGICWFPKSRLKGQKTTKKGVKIKKEFEKKSGEKEGEEEEEQGQVRRDLAPLLTNLRYHYELCDWKLPPCLLSCLEMKD